MIYESNTVRIWVGYILDKKSDQEVAKELGIDIEEVRLILDNMKRMLGDK